MISVSDITGKQVMNLDKGQIGTGTQKFSIDCSSLNAGIYFYTVKIGGESFTHKMIIGQ